MSAIDLHTHSTASDGSLSPGELVRAGKNAGLRALALTDHDTVAGLEEAVRAGQATGLEVIPGCEISVNSRSGAMHLLGLWIPVRPRQLQTALNRLQAMRRERNEKMLSALRSLGIAIDNSEVKAVARGQSIGRPHIAQVLVRKGVAGDVEEAFDSLLGATGKAYVPKAKLSPAKAISLLKHEQATVILAHPFSLHMPADELGFELRRLAGLGLDGLEVYYSDHSREQTEHYLRLAGELGLVVSGGSDFHGRNKPDIQLGVGRGKLDLAYDLLLRMKEARRRQGLPM